ncbi:MAG: hypothetical protein IJK26_09705 [Clostridia bacterium]|nr:hypothetical protein [Clostridia bacterium]
MTFNPDFSIYHKSFLKTNPIIFEDAVTLYYIGKYCGYDFFDLSRLPIQEQENHQIKKSLALLGSLWGQAKGRFINGKTPDFDVEFQTGICCYQSYAQASRWNKSKQIYSFDADILRELARTDIKGITLPYDIFEHLPCKCLYLDFSANEELCNTLKADGCLIQVQAATLTEDNYDQYCVLLMSFYKDNDINLMTATVLANQKDGTEISMDELYEASLGLITTLDDEETTKQLRNILVIQTLLYLCSYEPDIHETPASKMKHRKMKQNKKAGKNTELPTREFKVGERFGEAFRKWTKGQLGQSSDHTPTGRHNKPHLRRAHWHRHWLGKRDGERRLVIKWHSECFCGVTEDEADGKLDTVRHTVS